MSIFEVSGVQIERVDCKKMQTCEVHYQSIWCWLVSWPGLPGSEVANTLLLRSIIWTSHAEFRLEEEEVTHITHVLIQGSSQIGPGSWPEHQLEPKIHQGRDLPSCLDLAATRISTCSNMNFVVKEDKEDTYMPNASNKISSFSAVNVPIQHQQY